MADVFISYCHADRFFAQLLEKELDGAGISCWRDVSGLRPGAAWRDDIDVAIADCRIVILALSEASVESKYVNYEWAFAMGMQKTIIPVMLADCSRHAKVEPIQYLDFRSEPSQDWNSLIDRIKEYRDDAELNASDNKTEHTVEASSASRTLAQEIYDYISSKGFRIISKERVRKSIRHDSSDDDIDAAIKSDARLRSATTRGYKPGVAIL